MSAEARKTFFAEYRAAFGKLRQSQVDGLNILLDMLEVKPWGRVEYAAYFLATVKHECADTWWPISEYGQRSYFDKYEPNTQTGRRLGNTQPGDGYLFRGRGYVQITGRANYERASSDLCWPLASHPDAALWPEMAYSIAMNGMTKGRFTGKSLDDYMTDAGMDYVNARRVINGTDQAELIAGYAKAFEAILRNMARPFVTGGSY